MKSSQIQIQIQSETPVRLRDDTPPQYLLLCAFVVKKPRYQILIWDYSLYYCNLK